MNGFKRSCNNPSHNAWVKENKVRFEEQLKYEIIPENTLYFTPTIYRNLDDDDLYHINKSMSKQEVVNILRISDNNPHARHKIIYDTNIHVIHVIITSIADYVPEFIFMSNGPSLVTYYYDLYPNIEKDRRVYDKFIEDANKISRIPNQIDPLSDIGSTIDHLNKKIENREFRNLELYKSVFGAVIPPLEKNIENFLEEPFSVKGTDLFCPFQFTERWFKSDGEPTYYHMRLQNQSGFPVEMRTIFDNQNVTVHVPNNIKKLTCMQQYNEHGTKYIIEEGAKELNFDSPSRVSGIEMSRDVKINADGIELCSVDSDEKVDIKMMTNNTNLTFDNMIIGVEVTTEITSANYPNENMVTFNNTEIDVTAPELNEKNLRITRMKTVYGKDCSFRIYHPDDEDDEYESNMVIYISAKHVDLRDVDDGYVNNDTSVYLTIIGSDSLELNRVFSNSSIRKMFHEPKLIGGNIFKIRDCFNNPYNMIHGPIFYEGPNPLVNRDKLSHIDMVLYDNDNPTEFDFGNNYIYNSFNTVVEIPKQEDNEHEKELHRQYPDITAIRLPPNLKSIVKSFQYLESPKSSPALLLTNPVAENMMIDSICADLMGVNRNRVLKSVNKENAIKRRRVEALFTKLLNSSPVKFL